MQNAKNAFLPVLGKKCQKSASLQCDFCSFFVVLLVRLTPIFGESAKQKKWGKSG
jgi:hypothetical protein